MTHKCPVCKGEWICQDPKCSLLPHEIVAEPTEKLCSNICIQIYLYYSIPRG